MQKLIVFGRGRSGTTLLADELGKHPQIRMCLHELKAGDLRLPVIEPFARPDFEFTAESIADLRAESRVLPYDAWRVCRGIGETETAYGAWLEEFEQRMIADAETSFVGFKIIDNQLGERPGLLEELVRRDFRIVSIHRCDLFRHALSGLIARQRGVFNERNYRVPDQRYVIDPRLLLQAMHDIVVQTQRWDDAMKVLDAKVVRCAYEDRLASRAAFYAPIFGFLGVRDVAITETDYTRMVPDDLTKVIANFHEIAAIAHQLGAETSLAHA
jgi:LPS sulfotransferase NodH